MRDGTSASRADQAAEGGLGSRSFVASIVLHALLVVAILVAGFVSFHKPKKSPLDELSEFTVAIPDEPEPEPEKPEETQKPEPEPEPEPEPAPVRDPIPVPATTKPKPTRPPIDTSKAKLVRKTVPTTTRRIVPLPSTRPPAKTVNVRTTPNFSGPRLSPEELQKLLALGATVSDHTSIPADELHRCYALIQKQLYAAWIRPSADSANGREPVVSISIGPGGTVRSASLRTSSGDAELDRSAVAAARAVTRFTGLSEDFVRENPTFTVAFKLEGAL
jgi:TonB family protein